MQMDAGPTRKLAVRKAVNFAIDRQAVVLAIGGAYAGAPASTVLSPTLAGYSAFDLYPSQDAAGDPDKARELLAEAGYPDGGPAPSGSFRPVEFPVRGAGVSLCPVRIKLEPTLYEASTLRNRCAAVQRDEHTGRVPLVPDVPATARVGRCPARRPPDHDRLQNNTAALNPRPQLIARPTGPRRPCPLRLGARSPVVRRTRPGPRWVRPERLWPPGSGLDLTPGWPTPNHQPVLDSTLLDILLALTADSNYSNGRLL